MRSLPPVHRMVSSSVLQIRTNAVQVARALLALSILLTLALSADTALFRLLLGAEDVVACHGHLGIGAYCALPERWMATAIGIAISVWVLLGYCPRLSAIPQAWFAFSFDTAVAIGEGGDQVISNMAAFLAVVALLDGRRWAWSLDPSGNEVHSMMGRVRRDVAALFVVLAQLQVAFVYLHSSTAKFAVPEWSEGSALYYIFNGNFGLPGYLDGIGSLFAIPVITSAGTWLVMLVELLLAFSLLFEKRFRVPVLAAGVAFHVGIILFMGLWTFGIAMFACIVVLAMDVRRDRLGSVFDPAASAKVSTDEVGRS